jgi:methionine biosynthesis protein MetW
MSADQVARFEDHRWSTRPQVAVWRHRAAVTLVRETPVLDVGGGDGLLLRMLADRGMGELALADLSPVAVERSREAGIQAEVVDITQPLPYADASFGTVCALDVLEHLYDPLPPLREMARVGRELVLVVPNFHYWRERAQMVAGRIPFQSRPDRGHIHWFNPATFHALLAEAGLAVDQELREAPARLGAFGTWLAATRPSLFASAVAVRARPATSAR